MEEQYIEDPCMKMEEDGEASVEAQLEARGDGGNGGAGESEGSKIDASKNEEDEG